MTKQIAFLLCFFMGSVCFAFPKEFPAEARLFIGSTSVSPEDVNQVLSTDSLKKLDSVFQYGVEVTYPALEHLEIGVRYSKHTASNDESPSNAATDYYSQLDQDVFSLLARIPFYKSNIFRADIFGGFGGTNTSFKIQSASESGELTKKAATGWFASPYSVYGASAAVGYHGFYFFLEGGYESNQIKNPDSSGLTHSISKINLSGSYVLGGIMFDGIKATTK